VILIDHLKHNTLAVRRGVQNRQNPLWAMLYVGRFSEDVGASTVEMHGVLCIWWLEQQSVVLSSLYLNGASHA